MLQLSPVAAAFKRSPVQAASPAGQPPLRGAARAGNLVLGEHGDRPPHPLPVQNALCLLYDRVSTVFASVAD